MMKKLFLSTIISAASVFAMAQTQNVTHVVQRGETLESIAEYYHVSVDDINKANPNAEGLVYVGMKLVVPVIDADRRATDGLVSNDQEKDNTARPTISNAPMASQNSVETSKSVAKGRVDMSDFNFYGVGYRASFEYAGEGFYGLGGNSFVSSGFGVNFYIGANYGLVKKDYAGMYFCVGPVYGYAYNNILLMTSLDFMGTYVGTGEDEKTGTNHKGETYTYKGTDNEFSWGINFTPTVGIKLNKVTPYLGLDFVWTKDAKKIDVGFLVGLGFDI